jgi:tetratricopeptide (TPR) repeat protein
MRTRDLHLHDRLRHRLRHRFHWRLTLLVLLAMAVPARAQEAEPDATPAAEPGATPTTEPDATPAAEPGATPAAEPATAGEDAHARAGQLFDEGNQLVEKYRLARAVEKYRQALEHWDHPAIHFNLAKALYALGRPLEAYRHAELALQGNPELLGVNDDGKKNQDLIRELQNELRSELAAVEIQSASRGVQVAVDSERVAPGSSVELLVLPGTHRMSAQKRGHNTLSEPFTVRPGESVTVALSSYQPMAPWKPWTVTGSGLALALGGSILSVQAWSSRDALERRAREQCLMEECRDAAAEALASDWSSAEWRWRIGLASIAVGTGAMAVGGYFFVRNWQRELRMSVVRRGALSLTPTLSPALTGMSAAISF